MVGISCEREIDASDEPHEKELRVRVVRGRAESLQVCDLCRVSGDECNVEEAPVRGSVFKTFCRA